MFQSIWDDVKREFRYGNMVTQLIIAITGIFVVVNILKLLLMGIKPTLYFDFMQFFSMPSEPYELLTHPWAIITSAFLHRDIGHILWNMLVFYWFGRIVGDLLGNHRILPLFILGAVFGNLTYFLVANTTSLLGSGTACGASGAVMAMIACATFIAPEYTFNILFIGPVRLKYIAMVLIFIDLVGIGNYDNTGGRLAHLGGVAMGFIYAAQLRNGIDLGKPITKIVDFFSNLFKPNPKKKFTYQRGEKIYTRGEKADYGTATKGSRKSDTVNKDKDGGSEQDRLDLILDKIKHSGYESLTKEEKEFLFNASKK